MKLRPIYSAARLSLPFATALVALFNLTAQRASAINLYWDTNGASAGSGAATGTWGTDLFWSTDVIGESATTNTPTTGVDDLFFSAGTNGTGGVVTVDTSRTARKLTFEEDAITLSGGTLITLAGGGGITVDATAGNTTVSTALTLNGNNIFNVGSVRTLTLDTGAFDRSTNRATLNIQGAGTVISTKAGLDTNSNLILGPWASFDTAGNTTYAAFNGTTLGGLTYAASPSASEGTLVTSSTAVISTGSPGTVNYSLDAAGTLGTSANINTLRYTGAAGTLATATTFTTRGIMNSGTGLLTFGAVTSGGSGTELVVNTANNDITFSGLLTGTLIKTGTGTMTLGGFNHNLGGITVNQGILITNRTLGDALPSATINSGGTLRYGAGGKFANTSVITINAGGTLDLDSKPDLIGGIAGAGLVTSPNNVSLELQGNQTFSGVIQGGIAVLIRDNGDQTFSGLNTYTRVTQIGVGGTAGTLRVNSIRNVNEGPSAIGNPSTAGNGVILLGSVAANGTLVYTGTGHSSNRQFQIGTNTATPGVGDTGGAIIQADGASNAALTLTSSPFNSQTNAATGVGADRTLTLQGSSTGLNTISGIIRNNLVSGTATGTATVGVTKAQAGTWVLSGTNTYTGDTTVSDGTLVINGNSSAATGAVNVNGSSTLGGNGTLGGTVTLAAAANLSPGATAAVGTLSILSNLNISAQAAGTGKLIYALGPIATSDKVAVTGTLDIGTDVLNFSDFTFSALAGLQNGTYKLITSSGLAGGITLDPTPGSLTGTLGAGPGIGTLQVTGGDLELLVTGIAPGDPYLAWAGVGVNFDADANNDGVQNGLAWLLGAASPSANALGLLPTTVQSGGSLQMTFSMLNAASRGAAAAELQHSSDLGIWTSVLVPDTSGGPTSGVTFVITPGSPLNAVQATISSSESVGGKLFGRLKGVK